MWFMFPISKLGRQLKPCIVFLPEKSSFAFNAVHMIKCILEFVSLSSAVDKKLLRYTTSINFFPSKGKCGNTTRYYNADLTLCYVARQLMSRLVV